MPTEAGDRHQEPITFHNVNILFRQGNFHAHFRRVVRLISRDVVSLARHGRGAAAGENGSRSRSEKKITEDTSHS